MKENELKVQQKQEVAQMGESTKHEKYYIPAVDIFESKSEVTVVAEMPGIPTDGIEVTLDDDVLTIRGRKNGQEVPSGKVLLQEYEAGNFQRRFTVAETIEQDSIKATLANGVLRVVLPKAAPAKPRKIEVRINEE